MGPELARSNQRLHLTRARFGMTALDYMSVVLGRGPSRASETLIR